MTYTLPQGAVEAARDAIDKITAPYISSAHEAMASAAITTYLKACIEDGIALIGPTMPGVPATLILKGHQP